MDQKMFQDKTIGLKKAAQKKQQDTIVRVEAAIKKMKINKDAINFTTVSKIAKVSRTWLYKQSEFKNIIQKLNSSNDNRSNAAIAKDQNLHLYKKLKDKTRKIQQENIELKKQIEILYGKLYQNDL